MSSPPTDYVLEGVYRRATIIRRRRRWRAAWIATPVLLVLIAIPLALTSGQDDASQVVTDDGTNQDAAPPPASVIYAVGIPQSNRDAPPILQIDAATMEVRTRYAVPQLPQTTIPADELPSRPPADLLEEPIYVGGSSPDSLRLSSDGSTLYFRIVGGTCGGSIYAVDVNDPASARPVIEPQEGTGVGDFVPTSDGRIVWYECSKDFMEGSIVVTDLVDGSENRINYDPRRGTVGLSVSPDAKSLAVAIYAGGILPAEVRVVALDAPTDTLVQDVQPLVPSAGCGFDLPSFNPATSELYLIETCGPILGQGGQLVARNLADGSSRLIFKLTDDEALVDFDLDATGEHLLFSMLRATSPSGKVGDGAEPSTFRVDERDQPVRLQLVPNATSPGFRGGYNLVW